MVYYSCIIAVTQLKHNSKVCIIGLVKFIMGITITAYCQTSPASCVIIDGSPRICASFDDLIKTNSWRVKANFALVLRLFVLIRSSNSRIYEECRE